MVTVNRVSSYKCSSCAKRLNSSGAKVSDAHSPILNEEIVPVTSHEPSGTEANLHKLVTLLCRKSDDIVKDVKGLKT